MKRTRAERDAGRDAHATAVRDTLEMCFSLCTQQGMPAQLAVVVAATVATKLASHAQHTFDPAVHAERLLNSTNEPVPSRLPSSRRARRARRTEPLPFRDYVFGIKPRAHIPSWAKLLPRGESS